MRDEVEDDEPVINDGIDWILVTRYVANLCTPAEARSFEQWLDEQPVRRREVELLRAAWTTAEKLPIERHSDEAFQRFARRAKLTITTPIASPTNGASAASKSAAVARGTPPRLLRRFTARRSRSTVLAFTGLAAGLAAVVTAVVWGSLPGFGLSRGNATALREYTTSPAQRASVQLSDGTQAMLSPASRLRVMTVFDRGPRVVELEGEAYFIVKHDEARPFIVRTARVDAEDLGTAFMVRAHASDTVTEITVVEGEVALRASRETERRVVLARGQMGRVQSSGTVSVESDVDLEALLARTQGRLIFRKVPLADVRRELERWYDVRIAVSDPLLDSVPVSATFDNRPMDDALQTLARLLSVRYERNGMDARLFADPSR
jgi:ferric-dicitrate binding protein FerR (iron transport regulator)